MARYACSDWHGYYELYRQVKADLSPEDIVYFLGDANDRGPDGWKLMKAIYNDPQFIYIKGNHEQMFIDNAYSWKTSGLKDEEAYKFNTHWYRLIKANGGVRTFDDWRKARMPMNWLSRLQKLPLYAVYKNQNNQNIFLSHAGCTLWVPDRVEDGSITLFDDLLWSREHFYDDWEKQHPQDWIVVHGHTPIPALKEKLGDWKNRKNTGAYWYANNHKCCIDQYTVSSGMACLLNLDTFEYKMYVMPEFVSMW